MKRILIVAPFALEPKGTTKVRIIPIGKILQELGYNVEVLVPPYDNANYSGQNINVDGVSFIHLRIKADIHIGFNINFFLGFISLVIQLFVFLFKNRNNYDLFYVFKPKGLSGLACSILNLLNRDYILDTDDWEGKGGWNDKASYNGILKKVFEWQEVKLLNKAKKVSVASRALETISLAYGVKKEKLFYLPNGYEIVTARATDIEKIQVLKNNLQLNGKLVVIYYTRFFEFDRKLTFQYMERILNENTNIAILVLGKGPNAEEQEFIELVSKSKNKDLYKIIGWVDFHDIGNYISIADFGLYLFEDNLINRTKCPAKLVELLSYGIPVIGSNVGQIPEFIENGKNGYIFNNATDLLQKTSDVIINIKKGYFNTDDLVRFNMEKLTMKPYVARLFNQL